MGTVIVAGAPVDDSPAYALAIDAAGFVIAADSGADLCVALGRLPDLFVGDADSVSAHTLARLRESGVESIFAPTDKDLSDLDLALDAARERGDRDVLVLAAWGGRADHELAVLGSLFDHADLEPRLAEPGRFDAWLLAAGARESVTLSAPGRTFSLMAGPLGTVASVDGARWPLHRVRLEPLSRRGLSNEVAEESAQVTVHDGALLVLLVGERGARGV